jgi:heme exporter protein C
MQLESQKLMGASLGQDERARFFHRKIGKIGRTRVLGFAAPAARNETARPAGGSAKPQVSAFLALPIFRSSCEKISLARGGRAPPRKFLRFELRFGSPTGKWEQNQGAARYGARMRPRGLIVGVWAVAALSFFALILFVFLKVPEAQPQAGGIAQKIFYFHMPSAIALYVSGGTCLIASALYLANPTDRRDAWAQAGAECAVAFGSMAICSGSLWGRKAWGVFWTWDPRLTSVLLAILIYAAIVLMRRFAGGGDAERRFAAAFGILGTAILPIVHYSVQLWGGNHPTVLKVNGGGGLRDPAMTQAIYGGLFAMTLLVGLMLTLRAQLAYSQARLLRAEELALDNAETNG